MQHNLGNSHFLISILMDGIFTQMAVFPKSVNKDNLPVHNTLYIPLIATDQLI